MKTKQNIKDILSCLHKVCDRGSFAKWVSKQSIPMEASTEYLNLCKAYSEIKEGIKCKQHVNSDLGDWK